MVVTLFPERFIDMCPTEKLKEVVVGQVITHRKYLPDTGRQPPLRRGL